jgi:phage-related baseplate assembly protein
MPRFNLPEIEFVSKSVEETELSLVNRTEELMGATLSNADPRRKFIQVISYALTIVRNSIDYSAKQRLLGYAEDDFLEHLGIETPRLEPKKAISTERFELSMAAGEVGVIPAGTRVTGNNEVYFATIENVAIKSDLTFVDIAVECTEAGTIGNEYLPNQINQLVDPLPWVSKVYNITKSEGGADREEDDPYAERIRLSKEAYSTAGPEDAFKYHAKRASQLISDVAVRLTEDSTVEITPLLIDGELPTTEILDLVAEACNDRKVRPLTDKLIVTQPVVVNYEINVTYYIPSEKENLKGTIQKNVSFAIEQYTKWQESKLGRSIDPSELNFLLRQAGAKPVEIHSPVLTTIDKNHVAKVNLINVVYGGISND